MITFDKRAICKDILQQFMKERNNWAPSNSNKVFVLQTLNKREI